MIGDTDPAAVQPVTKRCPMITQPEIRRLLRRHGIPTSLGNGEPLVTTDCSGRIWVWMPGKGDPARAEAALTAAGYMFRDAGPDMNGNQEQIIVTGRTDDDDGGLSGWDIDVDTLRGLQKLIADDEAHAIGVRWMFGKLMLDSRGDRQRLPKGALAAMSAATGISRRELQYRMAFADKFPTETDMRNVLHLSWHEIIGAHLTSRAKADQPELPAGEKPGKVVDGYSIMRDADVIKELKDWEHNIFRKASIGTWSVDSRIEMIRLLKRIADRLQNNL